MFKRGRVVMLPTNNKAKIECNLKTDHLDIFIGYASDCDKVTYIPNHSDAFKQFMELYIVTNDTIHAGDWVTDGKSIFHIPVELDGYINLYKIIATTDVNIELVASPSSAFIEKYVSKYNKGEQIIDILVEYEEVFLNKNSIWCKRKDINDTAYAISNKHEEWLKIDSKDNTITIRPMKTLWTRDEIVAELSNAIKKALANPDIFSTLDYTDYNKINDWINQQL
jgi:hypothetical protein